MYSKKIKLNVKFLWKQKTGSQFWFNKRTYFIEATF